MNALHPGSLSQSPFSPNYRPIIQLSPHLMAWDLNSSLESCLELYCGHDKPIRTLLAPIDPEFGFNWLLIGQLALINWSPPNFSGSLYHPPIVDLSNGPSTLAPPFVVSSIFQLQKRWSIVYVCITPKNAELLGIRKPPMVLVYPAFYQSISMLKVDFHPIIPIISWSEINLLSVLRLIIHLIIDQLAQLSH